MSLKMFKAILHTNKTREQLIAQYGDNTYTEVDIERMKQYYDACDGFLCIVYDAGWTGRSGYGLIGAFEETMQAKDKEVHWLMEQDPDSGRYIDQREEFDADWDSGEFAPDGCMFFSPEDVEILEEIR